MKRRIFAMVTLLCCFILFINGCSSNVGGNKTSEAFCGVLSLEDDGMYVWAENIGHMYVKCDRVDLDISPLDTVVIAFSKSDLISANGQFTDYFGEEQNYLYILENPQSIRYTTPEEPTFG